MVQNMASNANGMAFSTVGVQRAASEAQRRGSVLASRESLHQIMAKSASENSFRNKSIIFESYKILRYHKVKEPGERGQNKRDLVNFVTCTLVSRVNITFYILTKGYTAPGNQGTYDKLNQIRIKNKGINNRNNVA